VTPTCVGGSSDAPTTNADQWTGFRESQFVIPGPDVSRILIIACKKGFVGIFAGEMECGGFAPPSALSVKFLCYSTIELV
jgi:hypothetical protein